MPENNLDKEEAFKAVESGVQKWMDQKYNELGKWSLRLILAAAVTFLAKIILAPEWWQNK
jgi:hypothetical protein